MIYREELKELGWSNELLDAIEDLERAIPTVLESETEAYQPALFVEEWGPPPCTMIDLATTTAPVLHGLTLGRARRRDS
jgi:hypothetical protein